MREDVIVIDKMYLINIKYIWEHFYLLNRLKL